VRVPRGGHGWSPLRPVRLFSALCSLQRYANSFATAHAQYLERQRLMRVSIF
jgi:hypothetical protein